MSERPVPRRESPWGLSGGDHKQPKAHRCNDRAEDVIQVIKKSLQNPSFIYIYIYTYSTVPVSYKKSFFLSNPIHIQEKKKGLGDRKELLI